MVLFRTERIMLPRLALRTRKAVTRASNSHSLANVPDNSYAMSGCGWLMPFHVGVSTVLKAEGLMNDESHFSGSSGGAICALQACSEAIPCDETLELIIKMSKDRDVWNNMDKALRASLIVLATKETLWRCQGRLHITTTRVSTRARPVLEIFSQYQDVGHLIDCVAASSFIPMYGTPRTLSVPIRATGAQYIDGGLYALIPPVGKVTISPFSNAHFPGIEPLGFRPIDISLPKDKWPLGKLVYRALNPAPEKQLRELYGDGIEAAERWLGKQVLTAQAAVQQ